ncbi:MAG: hypothetical protein GY718_07080, partial [Lentisphaerae bacterium]|nr:hypothetical protein [Lentisphaerota bacterium]
QNGIKQKNGRKAFLPQRLSKDVFDQLVTFSCEYLEDEDGNGGSQMDYDAVLYCVMQILDFQQNPKTRGDVITDKDAMIDAIGMYCLKLQFELITRTKSLGLVINRPTLRDIFDQHRKIKIKVKKPESVSNFFQDIKNVSPKAKAILLEILEDMAGLNDLKEDITVH